MADGQTFACRGAVRIQVADDDDASRVMAVLAALGYEPVRDLPDTGDADRVAWAVERVAKRHVLNDRERAVLEHVIAGHPNEAIALDLAVSHATVKWHLHNLYTKTSTGTREGLLRLVLRVVVGEAG